MPFGQFGILPVGIISQRLYGALAVIQAILIVITASTIVSELWLCLGRRRLSRRTKTVLVLASEQRQREASATMRPESARRRS